mgnify:CR=1 FL=1
MLLAWGSKCAFFLFLCMYPTSVVLPSRRGAPRWGGEASGVAPRYLSGAPKRYVLSAGHLSQRAAGRWLASLGDDNIVDLLTAVTPIRARTTTPWHDNSSSEPHRSRNEAISVHADEAWTAAACNKVHITAADRRDDHVPTTATYYTKIRCGPTSSRRSSSRRTV